MKHVFRNLGLVLTRFKMASILNILGLSTAIAVFVVIMTQLYWGYMYNKSIKDNERIYVCSMDLMNISQYYITRPIGEMFGNSTPQIENYSFMANTGYPNVGFGRIDRSEDECISFGQAMFTNYDFVDLVSLKILEGSKVDFQEHNSVIIPKSLALKMWPDISPVSQSIIIGGFDTLTIAAVYEDFPSNCMFNNVPYINIGQGFIDNTSEAMFIYFYKILPNGSVESVENSMVNAFNDFCASNNQDFKIEYCNMIPFDDLYYSSSPFSGGDANKNLSILLLSVAVLIIVVALINYVNFFMALVPVRIRSVNINKIFGASVFMLRTSFVMEAVGFVIISFIVAMFWVEFASLSLIAEFCSGSLKFGNNLTVTAFVLLVVVVLGFCAGLFPALYITKFRPAMVLKGSFGRNRTGRMFRVVLVVLQFVVCLALIICGWFIIIQNNYMQQADYGFDRDRLINVNIVGADTDSHAKFTAELSKNPFISDIAFGDNLVIYTSMGWRRDFKDNNISFMSLPVSWNFLDFMGMEIISGRGFVEDDVSKIGGSIIFNQTAAKQYGISVGDKIHGHNDRECEVIGIVKDFNFGSLSSVIKPMALYEFGSDPWRSLGVAYVRLRPDADYAQIKQYIMDVVTKIYPDSNQSNISIDSFEQSVSRLYVKESKVSGMISLFSVVAIIIALVGVLGLITFETQYRCREIALRRIHGASIAEIVLMFCRSFGFMVLCSFLIAAPIAWYVVSVWLEGFAYRVSMHWWVFVGALLIVLFFTLVIIGLQTLRVAVRNPIDALKSE